MKDRSQFQIVCSTFSIRHNFKVAKEFWKDVTENGYEPIPNPPKLFGRKDDEWYSHHRLKLKDYGFIAQH